MNALRSAGKPLFFCAGQAADLGIETPANRLGVAVRAQVRALGGMQKEALVCSQPSGIVWRLASDEGAYLNGDDEAPCPLSFLTTGMVCSYFEEVGALARQRGIPIDHMRLIQDNYYTMQGSALRGTMTGGARDVELEARIASSADRDTLLRLLHDATVASPLHGLLRDRLESRFALRHNGRAVDCDRVAALAGEQPGTLSDAQFDAAVPTTRPGASLIERRGPSPKTGETTGFAGSSLAERQDRILHLRGICTLREDGLKQVEQQLFNPHGSIFHFLSEESNGSAARAPDAASLVAAGIAFCFMTQLGRYASIAKKRLEDCRIVQDLHFSPGGASAGTGSAGTAGPVETCVALRSAEDDNFARTALDMSEQTCFLHALCRTPLRVRVRLSAAGLPPA